MSEIDTLSWETLRPHLSTADASLLAMGGTRGVVVGWDGTRLFLRVPAGAQERVPKREFQHLDAAIVTAGDSRMLEVSTRSPHLFREFHQFAQVCTEDYEQPGRSAVEAYSAAVSRWQQLTAARQVLPVTRQVGLYGELLFLEALLIEHGARALSSWVGCGEQTAFRHDFRLDSGDIEVKTATGNQRHHTIHGLRQLDPAPYRALHILSIILGPAGENSAGRSLIDLVAAVRQLVDRESATTRELDEKLAGAGYSDEDAPSYMARYCIDREATVVDVSQDCPRITPVLLTAAIGHDVAARISSVDYSVNLEGLGWPEGSERFQAITSTSRLGLQ
jgi:hypothetical protein